MQQQATTTSTTQSLIELLNAPLVPIEFYSVSMRRVRSKDYFVPSIVFVNGNLVFSSEQFLLLARKGRRRSKKIK